MGKDESAKCGYCGEVIEDGYVRGDYDIYCSSDCRTAGRMKCWACILLFTLPYFVLFWMGYDNNLEILLFLAIFSLMTFYIAFLAVQGFRMGRRILKQKSEVVEYVDYN